MQEQEALVYCGYCRFGNCLFNAEAGTDEETIACCGFAIRYHRFFVAFIIADKKL